MFTEDKQKNKTKVKWMVLTVAACILIYLGIRYINVVASSILWLIQLVMPLLIGVILSLILGVPLNLFENKLFAKMKKLKSPIAKRYLGILLSFITVLGIMILVFFLVVPELIQAIVTLVNIGTNSLENMSTLEQSINYSKVPFGEYLGKINIDWTALSSKLQSLLPALIKNVTEKVPTILGSSVGLLLDIFLGLIFSVYILAHKENLIQNSKRLLQVWLPEKCNHVLFHVAKVCSNSFHNFIVGQTVEALILGTLCTTGMAILRLPYAPTIGVLVGVTAFIPYVGAYLGAIVGFIMILTVHPLKACIFLVFLVILQQIEGNIIYPKVVGNRINLPSIWVLTALTIGGNLAGPIGMILGVPIFSAIYNLINEATDWREQKLKEKTFEKHEEVSHE